MPSAAPEERAEMLMEIARGLHIKPRSARQLHDAVMLYRRALSLVPPGFALLAARVRAREGTPTKPCLAAACNARGDRVVESQEFFRSQVLEDSDEPREFELKPEPELGGFRLLALR